METIPPEITRIILSFLDDKNARAARVVSTRWFRWIKYAKFDIYFPTPTLLPQIVDRLSKYQYPIELSLLYPIKISDIDVLENISRLTQLKTLNFWDYDYKVLADAQEYFKLSTLTNLEFLDFGSDRNMPVGLLRHFPRLRQCDCMSDTKELIQMINTHCPHYERIRITDNSLLPVVPVSITNLIVNHIDRAPEGLTRLTKLKRLTVNLADPCPVDLRHVTWLESLSIDTSDITGLEHSQHLTELFITDWANDHAPTLIDNLTALSKLQTLGLFIRNLDVTLPTLPQLTGLWLRCKTANIATVGTSVQDLDLDVDTPFELTDLSHMVHLKDFGARGCITTTAMEPLCTLTRLESLSLSAKSDILMSCSTLVNLTYLHASKVDLEPHTIKCLTNLEFFSLYNSAQQATIDNVQYISHLTSLTIQMQDKALSFDFKVIEGLPLAYFEVKMLNLQNRWAVLPTLTTLEQLHIDFVENDENIASLAAFSRLTKLEVQNAAEDVTFVHMTRLTFLRDLSVLCPNNLSLKELSLKLTRLSYSFNLKE